MKLYHGTTESRARRVLIEGLRPRGEREAMDPQINTIKTAMADQSALEAA